MEHEENEIKRVCSMSIYSEAGESETLKEDVTSLNGQL